jgi:hypothetical protein
MGRFAHRYVAIGAMDALMRFDGFSYEDLLHGVPRFAKQRGVVQLRELAFVVDPRSESIGESAVRLHWLELPPGDGDEAPELVRTRSPSWTPRAAARCVHVLLQLVAAVAPIGGGGSCCCSNRRRRRLLQSASRLLQ